MEQCEPSLLPLLKKFLQYADKGVEVVLKFFDRVRGKGKGKSSLKAEITITNNSDKIAKVTVDVEKSSDCFAKVGPGASLTFDLNVETTLVFVTIVVDPDGTPDIVCNNYKCYVGRHVEVTDGGFINLIE